VRRTADAARRRAAGFALALWAIAGSSAGAQERALQAATIALPTVSPGFVVQYVADDLGLWAKHGVDMKTVFVQGVGAVNALIGGSVEFSESAAASPIRAVERGQHLLVIATLADRVDVQLVVRRPVAEAASFDPTASLAARARLLRGRTIAVEAIGGFADAYLRLIALRGGVDPDDLRVAPMLQSSMEAAFDARAIDGFVAGPPYPIIPVQAGTGVVVASGTDGDPPDMVPFGFIVMITRPEVCQQRRQLCLGVGGALKEATAFIADHPEAATAAARKRFPALSEAVLAATMAATLRATPRSPVTTASQLEHADLFNIAAGLSKPEDKRASYDDLFTDEYVR
jgi:NitT/TauT family transport system substrate-binding protein